MIQERRNNPSNLISISHNTFLSIVLVEILTVSYPSLSSPFNSNFTGKKFNHTKQNCQLCWENVGHKLIHKLELPLEKSTQLCGLGAVKLLALGGDIVFWFVAQGHRLVLLADKSQQSTQGKQSKLLIGQQLANNKQRGPRSSWIAHLRNRSKGHSGVPFHPRSTIWKLGLCQFWPQGHNLINFGRGPLDDAIYQYKSSGPCSFGQEDFW